MNTGKFSSSWATLRGLTLVTVALALASSSCGGSEHTTQIAKVGADGLAIPTHGLRIEGAILVPTEYRATLRLDPDKPTFAASASISVQIGARTKQFYLNGYGLTIKSAQLVASGKTYDLQVNADEEHWLHFKSEQAIAAGQAILNIAYEGKVDDKSSFGIFRQEAAKDWYLFTQFEARGARRAFPSFDQPNLKVPWILALDVPESMVALTNTPEVSRTAAGPGRVLVQFAKSKPMPSYLVAFTVGPFDMVDAGKTRSGTPVRVATPRGRGGEAGWAVESTLRLIEILEDYTGITYPYAKLDLVSIPATGSFGAMENAGLITYTETLLLSKDNSLAFKKAYASVGAHELAHQWFGNLVTNAWWDDLWLNESFATWAAAKTLEEFDSNWRSDISWLGRRASAMHADRLASARVIHQTIVNEGDIGAAFDGITYAKGASILTMFEGFLGKERFQRGIQHYLANNQWKAVTASDFLSAMDKGTGASVSDYFSTFIDNPGTPLLHLELQCAPDKTPQLKVSQSRYLPSGSKASAAQNYKIPMCFRYPTPEGNQRQCEGISSKEANFALKGLTVVGSCPAWIMPNDGATGYYRSHLPAPLLSALMDGATLSATEEMALADDLSALSNAGLVPLETTLSLVGKLAKSKDDGVVAAAAKLANLGSLVKSEDRARYSEWLRIHFAKRARMLGWFPKRGELPDVKNLRETLLSLLIFEAQDTGLRNQGIRFAQKWLRDPSSVDPDLAGLALKVGARFGTEADLKRYVEAIKGTSDRSRRRLLLQALGTVTSDAAAAISLALMLDADIPVRESARTLLQSISGQPETRALTFDFVNQNLDTLREKFGGEMESRLARIAGNQCDASLEPQILSFLNTKIAAMDGGKNAAKQALEQYRLCVARLASLSLPETL